MKRPMKGSRCPPAFFNPERETENALLVERVGYHGLQGSIHQ